MRTIKYRAYLKTLSGLNPAHFERVGRMFTVESINFETRMVGFRTPSWIEASFDDTELMEFTGLLDKNGVEIYEGDIIKNAQFRDIQSFHVLPVEWDEISCSFTTMKKVNDHFRLSHYAARHYEVIGNIHENPELLK